MKEYWCGTSRLDINTDKTKHMTITKEDDDGPCKIKLCGSSLDNAHTYNYLGVIVEK